MLAPEQFLPDDPWRHRIREALETRPCWSVVVDGAARIQLLSGARLAACAEALLSCRVVMAQRRHQHLWGPLMSVRIGLTATVGVVHHIIALDEAPIDDDGLLIRQTLRDIHAVLIGLAFFQPQLRHVSLPDELQSHLPQWSEICQAV